MSSSSNTANKEKDILIPGKGLTRVLSEQSSSAEKFIQ